MSLTPEKRALLRCVRMIVSGTTEDCGDLEGVDWPGVCDAAQSHQVLGLVYEAIKGCGCEGSLPQEARVRLLHGYHLTGMKNEHIRRSLAEILHETTREGVDVMLLKGAVLAYSVYERCEQRGMSDVDLLVRESDFAGFRRIAEGLGYETSVPHLVGGDLVRYAHCFEQVRFWCRGRPPVETHFRLLNLGMPAAVEQAWDDASAHEFAGIRTWCASPERFLLHLCLHAQQHGFARLRYFADIALWYRMREIDSERFISLARTHNLGTPAFYALTYTADLLGLPGSERIREQLRPSAWKRLIFEFVWQDRHVRSQRARPPALETELPRAFLLGEAPVREKARFLWNVFLPPEEWLTSVSGRRQTRWGRFERFLAVMRRGPSGVARRLRSVAGEKPRAR